MSAPEDLYLERAWLIECSRCANEHSSFASEMHEAKGELFGIGWTAEADGMQYCPACNQGSLA